MANKDSVHIKSQNREMALNDNRYDGYRESVEYVKEHGDQMKFDTAAERRDYEKLVRSNPQNVLGMPTFFPPLKLQSTFSFDSTAYTREMIQKEYWKYCEDCHKIINAHHYDHECESLQQRETI